MKYEEIAASVKSRDDFLRNKECIFTVINQLHKRNSAINLHAELIKIAFENQLSRPDIYVLITEILLEINTNSSYSEIVSDQLDGFLDGLTGNVSHTAIFPLYNEPKDKEGLLSFVRSQKWRTNDFAGTTG